jgi:hypothetical protein
MRSELAPPANNPESMLELKLETKLFDGCCCDRSSQFAHLIAADIDVFKIGGQESKYAIDCGVLIGAGTKDQKPAPAPHLSNDLHPVLSANSLEVNF